MHVTPKLNSKGFSHILILMVVVVLIAVAGSGLLVYKHQHKAHANGYWIQSINGYTIGTCEVPQGNGNYIVQARFTKPASYPRSTYELNSGLKRTSGNAYYANTVAVVSLGGIRVGAAVYASISGLPSSFYAPFKLNFIFPHC